jgi:hypothetical protein
VESRNREWPTFEPVEVADLTAWLLAEEQFRTTYVPDGQQSTRTQE